MPKEKKPYYQVPRTIEFHRVRQISAEYPQFDIDSFVKCLTEHEPKDRWVQIQSNNELFYCWHEKGEYLHKFRIGITRSHVRGGAVNLNTAELVGIPLPEEQEACEYSHLIIFPDNFVALEYNTAGPRLTQFEEFITKKLGAQMGIVKFDPVASKNFEANLQRVTKFGSISFTVSPANSELYKQMDRDFEKHASAEIERTGAGRLTLTYSAPRGTDALRDFATKWAKKIFKVEGKPEDTIRKMGIRFKGPRQDAVKRNILNLMDAKITTTRNIDLGIPFAEKRLDPESAFAAIRSAYDEMLPTLKNCVVVEFDD